MASELVFEDFLEFMLMCTHRLLRLLVKQRDLTPSLQELSLTLICELLQRYYLTIERVDKLFLLVSNFLDLIFSYFQLLVKLSLLQLQQGLALPELYKFLLVGALHLLKLLLADFFLRVESILKSFQRISNLINLLQVSALLVLLSHFIVLILC